MAKTVKKYEFVESAMKPIEIVREALQLVLKYPFRFQQADVTLMKYKVSPAVMSVLKESERPPANPKNDQQAVVRGRIRTFSGPPDLLYPAVYYTYVTATLKPNYYLPGWFSNVELKMDGKTYLFRYDANWTPGPTTSPLEVIMLSVCTTK